MQVIYIKKVVSKKNNKTYYILVAESNNKTMLSKFIKYTELKYYESFGIDIVE